MPRLLSLRFYMLRWKGEFAWQKGRLFGGGVVEDVRGAL